jgi:hypothetical protein
MKNKVHLRWRLGLHASLCLLVLSAISVQEMYCWLMAQKLHSVKDCSYTNRYLVMVEGLDLWQYVLLEGMGRNSFGWMVGLESRVAGFYRPKVCVAWGKVCWLNASMMGVVVVMPGIL